MITDRILISGEYRKRCQNTLNHLYQQLKWFETWSVNTDLKDFKYLQKKGIYIHLYLVEKTKLNLPPKDQYIVTFASQGDKIPVALFARSDSEKLNFKEEPLPVLPLKEIKRLIVRKKRQLEKVEYYLADQMENISLLHDYQSYLQDRLNARDCSLNCA